MGQLDDELLNSGLYIIDGEWTTSKKHNQSVRNRAIDDYISGVNVNVQNRSDIINPTEILSQYDFGNSSDERKKYSEYLEALKALQTQQEASYEEWYESPEQQNIRDRQAGLNPDIVGLSGSQAAEAPVGSANPLEQIPTRAENFSAFAGGVGSIVNSVASLASLPSLFSSFGLAKAQKESVELSNLREFESLVSGEISSRLSDSVSSALRLGESLDIASWFADEKNTEGIFESYSPVDNARYRSSFQNVRKRMQQNLGKAYEQGKITAENQGSFSELLADSTYSADQLIQIAQLRPYMSAVREAKLAKDKYDKTLSDWNSEYQKSLSVDSAVDAANAKNLYDSDYYKNYSGAEAAARDIYIKECESIRSRMQAAIDNHLLSIYEQNPNNIKGISAAYVFMGGTSAKWSEFFGSYALSELQDINELPTLYDENGVPYVSDGNGKYVQLAAPSDVDDRVSLGSFK